MIFNQEKANLLIPEHMHDALRRYLDDGIIPGSFLTAVLENNLKEACARADSTNLMALARYVDYLYNYAPSVCYGSPAKVDAWIKSFKEGL